MFTESQFCRATAYLVLFVSLCYAGARLALWWIDQHEIIDGDARRESEEKRKGE